VSQPKSTESSKEEKIKDDQIGLIMISENGDYDLLVKTSAFLQSLLKHSPYKK